MSDGYEIRAALEDLVVRDLLGPWDDPEEELPRGTTPGERYLLGKLSPAPTTERRPHEATEPAGADGADPDEVSLPDDPSLYDEGTVEVDGEADEAPSSASVAARRLAASSIGLSCALPSELRTLLIETTWGRYERVPSETQETETGRPALVWKRVPAGGVVELHLGDDEEGREIPDPDQEGVELRWRRRARKGHQILEVFLVNNQPEREKLVDLSRIFQVGLTLRASDESSAIFLPTTDTNAAQGSATDPELRLLDLQHRNARLYATGRQCAVEWDERPGERRAWRLRTTCFPAADVPAVDGGDPSAMSGVVLDMARLGDPSLSPEALRAGLSPLVVGYRDWLERQAARLQDDEEVRAYEDVARPALEHARELADRLERAIELLVADPIAREAFRLANLAMARQRVHTELVRRRAAEPSLDWRALEGELDTPALHSWRPFQLAFLLACLPGLTDPAHRDAHRGAYPDGQVQLLFFPTGGGKTEAYLGLIAYTIAIRRLQGLVGEGEATRDGSDGVAVIMRYTLRLLTAQQFQRATTLIAALELARREAAAQGDTRLGDVPFRIGLWVGASVTPNSYDEAERQHSDATERAYQAGGLQQFANCPWCGTPIDLGKHGKPDQSLRRFFLFCGDPDGRCPFSARRSEEGIPALVVDEEIYRLTPALLIATVDKFAQLPWKDETAHLFGHVLSRCPRHGYRPADPPSWCGAGGHRAKESLPAVTPESAMRLRPPDLLIQDELHLIADALGSMVGLYESAIDHLCTRTEHGRIVRPVLVASTATVRRAESQVRQVFARSLSVFPPPLFDANETFFSRVLPESKEAPARRYRGILAVGERLPAVEIRVMTALLEFGQYLLDRDGEAADPYLSVVDYFTSIRELAGMRRLVEDDVTERLSRRDALVRRRQPTIAELTSRMPSQQITQALANLERRFELAHDSTAARQAFIEQRKAERGDRGKGKKKATEEAPLRPRPIDVLLATSMLQVGVDVPRLGLMVVTGQPKNMAEYIQATSRVGRSRSGPGLVFTLYHWTRPRDLAYYEHFAYEHASFGRRVEGLTTTPFAARALDRGLAGVVVSLVRHAADSALPNDGAARARIGPEETAWLVELLSSRAKLVTDDPGVGSAVGERARDQLDDWHRRRTHVVLGSLGYESRAGATAALLQKPEKLPWTRWHAPMSLREVEPNTLLQLRRDDPSTESAPRFHFRGVGRESGGDA
jgi:hypothetical protein